MTAVPTQTSRTAVEQAAGRRGLVGGQEDMLIDIALDLSAVDGAA